MARILVTEEIAPAGLDRLRDAGHEVDVQLGLSPDELLVAQRALAFGMRLVAFDPFVAPDRARQMGVELLPLEEVVRVADVVTIHLPKTPETLGLVGKDLLAQAKPGLRIVNTARGGIVDEEALPWAIGEG